MSLPLKLVMHGIDNRSMVKLLNFMQNQMPDRVTIVNGIADANIDLFDADDKTSKKLLERHLKYPLLRPAIVLSNKKTAYEGVLSLLKPISKEPFLALLDQAEAMMAAFALQTDDVPEETVDDDDFFDFFNDELSDYIAKSTSSWDDEPVYEGEPEIYRVVYAPDPEASQASPPPAPNPAQEAEPQPDAAATVAETPADIQPATETGQPPETLEPEAVDNLVIKEDLAALETAIYDNQALIDSLTIEASGQYHYVSQDEKGFYDYLDSLDDASNTTAEDYSKANYSPNIYFQGYFQLALKSCLSRNKSVMIQSDWCPIALLPYSQEVWLEASDAELKSFAEIRMQHKSIATQITVIPIDTKEMAQVSGRGKFQSMESFTWKLACWTSKGRYPDDLDYYQPVYLSQWPNFTRLLSMPNALRIAALLIKGPRTMLDVAQTLNINPRHVFVFISAARAIGLAGTARRLSDNLVQAEATNKKQTSIGRFFSIIRRNG